MAQSLAKALMHLVFSTKNRVPMLDAPLREEMEAYLVGALRAIDSPSLQTKCMADHVHILFCLSRNLSIAKTVEEIKKTSSRWAKTRSDATRDFYWQGGYGIFSVSVSKAEEVLAYLRAQEEHHRKLTFQQELVALLKRHGVEYDERYIWE